MGALYDALRTAQGISEEAAKGAAEEVANYDNRIARIEASMEVMKWMVGTNITLTLLILGKLFLGRP
jgi:hypothetical protein